MTRLIYGYTAYLNYNDRVTHASKEGKTLYPYRRNKKGEWINCSGGVKADVLRVGIMRGNWRLM